jgi:hypothetical protein
VTDVGTTDPPETYPQRPDQRIHARRLPHGRPAGHPAESYFRAGQGRGPPSRPVTCSWTSANAPSGSDC